MVRLITNVCVLPQIKLTVAVAPQTSFHNLYRHALVLPAARVKLYQQTLPVYTEVKCTNIQPRTVHIRLTYLIYKPLLVVNRETLDSCPCALSESQQLRLQRSDSLRR